MKNDTYPGFPHKASELSAYMFGYGLFTVSLKNRETDHFYAPNDDDFRAWLDIHKVKDILVPVPAPQGLPGTKTTEQKSLRKGWLRYLFS